MDIYNDFNDDEMDTDNQQQNEIKKMHEKNDMKTEFRLQFGRCLSPPVCPPSHTVEEDKMMLNASSKSFKRLKENL